MLLVGDPGLPFDEALGGYAAFYADRGLPAWAQVAVGSDEQRGSQDAGWVRPGRARRTPSSSSPASPRRRARAAASLPAVAAPVLIDERPTAAWLATDARAPRAR